MIRDFTNRLALLVSVCVALIAILPASSHASSRCAGCVADFAIYDPGQPDDGVWDEDVVALETLFATYGWTWQALGPADIDGGALGSGSDRHYGALIAPGGWAYQRNLLVTAPGEANIRAFIESGGGFVGFCAGAYWAASSVVWGQTATGGGGSYYLPGDYATYPYDLGLLTGSAQGPFGWTPWYDGTGVSLQVAKIDTGNPTMQAIRMPASTRFFYYGGPFFQPVSPPTGWEVWARAKKPPGAGSSIGDGKPAVVHFTMGAGTVTLFAYHPEILIHSNADGVELREFVDERAVDWQTGGQSWAQIDYQSWNLVHGTFQVALGEAPTPIPRLP